MGGGGGTPTIGIVSFWLAGDPYEREVAAGIVDAARARNANVVCFALKGTGSEFDQLIGRGNVDALVLLSGSLVRLFGEESLQRFCSAREGLPMASVAMQLPGVPTIRVDNTGGVKAAIAHLVLVHGRRRIGFIRGPEVSVDVRERFTAYRDALAEHGITADPDWVVSSQAPQETARAIGVLFDERRQELDALVAYNDATALAALSALGDRGISVPQDLAVVGFDDTLEAGDVIPPLTTISQGLREQGQRAATLLLDALEGRPMPPEVTLGTELVVRRSCGCFPRSVLDARANLPRDLATEGGASFDACRAVVAEEMIRILGPLAASAIERMVNAFASDLANPSSREFLRATDRELNRAARVSTDLSGWEDAISAMRRLSLPSLWADEERRSLAENIWQEARVLIGDTAQRAQAFQRFSANKRAYTLGDISQSLITAKDVEELTAVLARGLPGLEVKSCYVSLYENRQGTELATLVLGVDEGGRPSSHVGAKFETRRLVPDGVLSSERGYSVVAMPLSFKKEQLGVIVLEVHPGHITGYDELRKQFGAAFKRMEGEQELARLHAVQLERVDELERAHEALRVNQQKLLISERMASLGRLTAGMAHEMNTPLAAVRAAMGELLKLAAEYKDAIDDPKITKDDHREIAKEMQAAMRLADSAAERVAGFVRGIKSETRDLSSKDFRHFNTIPVIQESLLLLHHEVRKRNCTVTFEAEPGQALLYGAPGRLAQVVTNLVTNALDASGEKGGGTVLLRLKESEKGLELRVTDDGTGISPENLKRIFDPMFTSKPFGMGTGLGLTIVHDIVCGDFNGSIDVESHVGRGTTFVLRFASKAPNEPAAFVSQE